MSIQVLVVDDERQLTDAVASYFVAEGFTVDVAYDGQQALDLISTKDPELIVLDLMLPRVDGLEVCRQLRQHSDAYVIMLTAKDDEIDKVLGLSIGADDYLVKPFSPRELIARARAMLRRPRVTTRDTTQVLRFKNLEIDEESRRAMQDGIELTLTRTEFDLLATLVSRPKAAFTRQQIIEEVWGTDWFGDDHMVDVHVGHIRAKLNDDPNEPRYIRTVRGVGYGMAE